MSIQMITVPANTAEPVTTTETDGSLTTLQTAVGGWVEAVGIGNVCIYLDEEGKLKNRPANVRATKLAHRLKLISAHDVIVGDAVVTGFNDDTGENADAPDTALHFLTNVKV